MMALYWIPLVQLDAHWDAMWPFAFVGYWHHGESSGDGWRVVASQWGITWLAAAEPEPEHLGWRQGHGN